MTRRLLPIVVGVVMFSATACGTSDQRADPTTVGDSGIPASDSAVAADEALRAVPDGYTDCGSVSLSSGWPTTTMYSAEMRGQCIADAQVSGDPAQQAFSGRDNIGGIVGTITRVNGLGDFTVINYRIDEAGSATTTETTCTEFDTESSGPPTCPAP